MDVCLQFRLPGLGFFVEGGGVASCGFCRVLQCLRVCTFVENRSTGFVSLHCCFRYCYLGEGCLGFLRIWILTFYFGSLGDAMSAMLNPTGNLNLEP